MDRTNEFNHLVTSFEIPQKKPTQSVPETGLSSTLEEIDTILERLERQGAYERHVAEQKMRRVALLLEKYKRNKDSSRNVSAQNDNENLHVRNLKEIQAQKYTRMMVRYNNLVKHRTERAVTDVKRRESFSYTGTEQSQMLLEEEKQQDSEIMRNRMTTQMNELGQLVTDISLHVSLQGEEIRRIDELVTASEGFIKDSVFEIGRVWEGISDRRKRMIKFFSFWIFMALLFWYFRRK